MAARVVRIAPPFRSVGSPYSVARDCSVASAVVAIRSQPEVGVRLLELSLTRVGPFDEAKLRFLDDANDPRRVAWLTGENGTGKTIVIDAIRAGFGPDYAELERDLSRRGQDLRIEAIFDSEGPFVLREKARPTWGWTNRIPWFQVNLATPDPWVVDYWRSDLATDSPLIDGIRPRDPKRVLRGALQGTWKNADVTRELCYLDYLRDSRNPVERASGEALWAVAEQIVAASLLDGGRLAEVERTTFTPMVEQAGHLVPLQNLSSGNAWLIGRMLTLLGRMHTIVTQRGEDPTTSRHLPGLLLIDEAENHLHPKWQKRFVPSVLEIFPNLQIIGTTHSPFILASVPDARVFVCRYDLDAKTCTVTEESGGYDHLPVEEILASPAFDETTPFGTEISKLLQERDQAMAAGDQRKRSAIEQRLKELNPAYFAYLDLEERVAELRARR